MTSELRPAEVVWREAMGVHHLAMDRWALTRECPNKAAAAVIEADREAVRAPLLAKIERLTMQLEVESEPSPYCPICGSCGEDGCCGPQRCLYPTTEQAAELAKFKALAETLAGALGTAIPYIVEQATPCNGYKCREPWCLSCNYDEEDAEAAAGNGKAAKADATEALRQYKEARDAS